MRTDIKSDIVDRLISDYAMKERGEWLRAGKCPSCNQKEFYTHAESPWVIRCGRVNKCGFERTAKELYPDLYENFNKRYQPTAEKPNATADAYMRHARGFNLDKIKGWYRQEKFYHPHGDKGTATVRFDIDRAKDIYMERLIESVAVTDQDDGKITIRKQHFNGKHRGRVWQPPGLDLKKGDTVWLVEACIDAISLNLAGIKAVAMLSCGNYPSIFMEEHKDKEITWIFALDNDAAGKRYTKKWVKKAKEDGYKTGAAQIQAKRGTQKQDWNDLHILDELGEKKIESYQYHGNLLVAASPSIKSKLIWEHDKKSSFSFVFNNKMYWFNVNLKRYTIDIEELKTTHPDMSEKEREEKALQSAITLREICNCNPTFLYFLSHEATQESWYFANISFPNGRPALKTTFSGGQIASAAEFKKRLLSAAPGGLYTGSGTELNWIIKNHLSDIKQVKTVDFVGYSKEHEAYIFNDFAVKAGKIYKANTEDYIEIDKLSIKTLSGSFKFEMGQSHQLNTEWPELIYEAFGAKGLVALTFWFGSLFAEQIRSAQKSFPFLEVVGKPGSGKTTLIEFLWKTFGLEDTEGFDPSKSTFASIRRKFAQVSNMPIVLLEGDRDEESKYKKFDFNQLKDSYNGRAFGERGIKNGGNETYAPAFKAAVVIAQNADVQGSDAVMERIVHINISKENHTDATRLAADKLNQLPVEQLSYFMLKVITKEKNILEHFKTSQRMFEKQLFANEKIKTYRIAKNHAQLMALAKPMVKITGLKDKHLTAIYDFIEEMAIERERAIMADSPILQEFWEAYEYLNGPDTNPMLNHSRDENTIAINLNHFVRVAHDQRQQMPALSELKPKLKNTRTHKFVGIKAVNSNLHRNDSFMSQTVKCWVFEKRVR